MRVFMVLSLFSQVLSDVFDLKLDSSSLSLALENVTRHLFNLETQMLVSNYGVDIDTMTCLLLKGLNKKAMPHRLQNLEIGNEELLMDSSALLTFESFADVRAFNDKLVLTNEFYKPLQLFIYCQDATVDDIESLAVDVERKHENNEYLVELPARVNFVLKINSELMDIIQYEYFLVEDEQFVQILTFVWFSPKKCRKLHLLEVNKFSKRSLKWDTDAFVMEKLASFHDCTVHAAIEGYRSTGIATSFVPEQLADHLKYKLVRPETDKLDYFFSRACYNAVDRYRNTGNGNSGKSHVGYFITKPLEFTASRLAVPPGELYSEYDKLLMPFDDYVWVLIILTFLAAFGTILILYRVRLSTRNLIIGSNIRTPSMNITQIFFGIPQVAMPRHSFARFLAMSFIIYSLIIRTAWQGKMYEFMQKDVSKPELQTVEEMIVGGYTFYVLDEDFKTKYPESEISKRGKVVHYARHFDDIKFKLSIFDPKFKGVIQSMPLYSVAFNILTEGRFSKRLLEEELHVDKCGLKFPRHHHFYGIFDLKTQQLAESSVLKDTKFSSESWYKYSFDEHPKILTVAMLEPGFVIWLASLCFAVLAFLLEWMITLRDYLVIKFLLAAFYKANYDRIENTALAKREVHIERQYLSICLTTTK